MARHLGRGVIWLGVGMVIWASLNWLDGKPPLTVLEFIALSAFASGVVFGSWAEANP